MRAVLLAHVPPGDAFTSGTCAVAADELSARGYQVTFHDVAKLALASCVGCFDCFARTPGLCRFRDDGDDLVRAVVAADVLVLLGPVQFGGHAAPVKRALDRLLPMLSPILARQGGETYRRARYHRMPALVGIGTLPAPDPESARVYRTLVERNALHLHAPAFGAAALEGTMPTTEVRLAVQAAIAAVDRRASTPRARPTGARVGVRP
jgi:hypothetical protein